VGKVAWERSWWRAQSTSVAVGRAVLGGDPLEGAGQQQVVDGRHLHRDDAEDHAERAALLEGVAAEAAEPGDAVGQVDLVMVLELLAVRGGQDRRGDGQQVLMVEPAVLGGGRKAAADPHHRVAPDLQVQIRGASVDGDPQQVIDMHDPLLIGA
jgi:hypothetical protein